MSPCTGFRNLVCKAVTLRAPSATLRGRTVTLRGAGVTLRGAASAATSAALAVKKLGMSMGYRLAYRVGKRIGFRLGKPCIPFSRQKAVLHQRADMIRKIIALAAPSLLAVSPLPAYAAAGELFGGVYAHAVDTPLSLETGEGGADLQLGYRGAPIEGLAAIGRPEPYAFVSVNTAGDTDFVAAGLAWKVDLGRLYLRPGIGLSLNNGPKRRVDPATGERTELGSAVLFEPEFGVGVDLGQGASLEASWVHISGARLFNSEQNPGIDMIGVRVNWRI